jgi:hypothetical protein
MLKWFWHENDYEKGWECDFERLCLMAAFEVLRMNAKPRYDDESDPADGGNDCFSIGHYDKEDYVDPDAEWPAMKPVTQQKFKVGEKSKLCVPLFWGSLSYSRHVRIVHSRLLARTMSLLST